MLWADTPAELLSQLSHAIQIIDRIMTRNGLFLNFKPGKTAAVVALRGPGSKHLRQEHFSVSKPSIKCALTR
eukprot:3756905-Alexandrium_andersonii.AAC.1